MDEQLKRLEKFGGYADLELIRRWLESLDDKSPKTRAAYTDGLISLLGWTSSEGLDFGSLGPEEISRFRSSLVEAGRRPSTVSVYLAGVRSYYRWVEDAGLGEDAARKVKGVKQAKGFKKDVLSKEATWDILNAIDQSTLQGKRDYALINLMIRTGVREVELSRMDLKDYDFPTKETAILRVWGKGRVEKDDFVVLDEAALSPISDYLAARGRAAGAYPGDDEPLFTSLSPRNYGARLTTRSISRIVKERMRAVGIDSERYTAHSLRHSAVTYALLGGASVQEAQAMARHADISTTMKYAHNVNRLKAPAETKASEYLDSDE